MCLVQEFLGRAFLLSGGVSVNDVNGVYKDLLWLCMRSGHSVKTRNAVVNRRTVEYVEFEKTPLVSVRKTAWLSALREWEWFMQGSDNINDLHPTVRTWWKPWADPQGFINHNYSSQFRDWGGGFDQIEYLLDGIRDHPFSRRNVITTWNTSDMASPSTPITNCHGTVIQAFVQPDNKLDLFTYQRSVDVICGLPHNWIQYWAFLLWLASRTGKEPGKLQWMGGDVHVYPEHAVLAEKILRVEDSTPEPPRLLYTPSGEEFRASDFTLDSQYYPVIQDRAEMIV